jgi:hypothetical protein
MHLQIADVAAGLPDCAAMPAQVFHRGIGLRRSARRNGFSAFYAKISRAIRSPFSAIVRLRNQDDMARLPGNCSNLQRP